MGEGIAKGAAARVAGRRPVGARLLAVIALVLAMGATAQALPGDPPVESLFPADGASVKPGAGGISVTYRCPAYRQDDFGSIGGPESYDADFSRTPTLDELGRLRDRSGADGSAVVSPDGATCTSKLARAGGADLPQETGGRVFWQAYRDCLGCAGNRPETSPVRSFVIEPAPVAATFRAPRRLYTGYLSVFKVTTKAELSGAKAALQRRVGRRWRTIATEEFSEQTEFIAKLPAGRVRIRAVAVTAFSMVPLATRTVTVRRTGRRVTSHRDDGKYALPGKGPKSLLGFEVTNGGRTLRRFRASVTTACLEGTDRDFVFRTRFSALKRVSIAPDGSVVGQLKGKGGGSEQRLIGRLRGRRFTGTIFLSVGRCFGTRTVRVVRKR